MTAIIPKFQLSEKTHTGTIALKVANLEKQTEFYTSIIGLNVLSKDQQKSILGANDDKTPLLILKEIDNPLPLTRKTGLYHVAFHLPTRKDLGNALIKYITNKAPIIGASDHGYSEALYLTDPEGNGIEVYHDKPRDVWDIRADGEIRGITIEMDAEGVIGAADQKWQGFPSGTIVGHVHLTVADLDKTQDFYTDVLGLSLKMDFGRQAKFFATGGYHHHIGSNIWNGRNIPGMEENDLGLDYYTFFVPDETEIARIEEHLRVIGYVFDKDAAGNLWLMDPNKIKIQIKVEKV
ncbi:VOC family protein [Liquorilactobacillus hordei]|uniref:Catechol-2,3-dioxygenase subunit n=1 Tax=Liquorilactobacillus hordei DSM 19519 TaxID=1423759 RepID=A0A0R1MEP1_9LACO|nr:VOC family protein [Liquorilactobacillus hordei]KRL06438.1 catechol-2,3-dioxygenase subunit [Liquorilactobacillus hordei DSM 19519]QYH51290.1 VOC family protein [Liquorilactobacillus hordei DSM 19519]